MVSVNIVHKAGTTVDRTARGKPLSRFELFLSMADCRNVSLRNSSGLKVKGRITSIGVSDNSGANFDLTILDDKGEAEQVLAITDKLD